LNPVGTVVGVVGVKFPVQELTVYIETVFAGFPFNTYANPGCAAGTHAGGAGGVVIPPPHAEIVTANKIKTEVRRNVVRSDIGCSMDRPASEDMFKQWISG
jgi:hypothetical protein